MEIREIYSDSNVLVVFKPQGIETASAANNDTLEKKVGAIAVHRLDVNTEGLVIFAKNPQTKTELDAAFKTGLVDKTYHALAFGKLRTSPVTLSGWLVKDAARGTVRITNQKSTGALFVKTYVRLIKTMGEMSLLEIRPFTGRTHQIRAHLASIGISIAGDGKYGDFKLNKQFGLKKQCLSAVKLEFNFPKTSPLYYLNSKRFEISPTWVLTNAAK